MFFPAKVKSIPINAKVLEIGPSVKPHCRATAWLDKRFGSEDGQRAQRCSPLGRDPGFENRITYYEDDRFPFEDNAFDYVICSHVIEHIPRAALATFIREMQRVAPCGYIEVPLFLYELVFPQEVHLWHIAHQNNTLLLAPKQADPDEAWSLTGTLAKALGAVSFRCTSLPSPVLSRFRMAGHHQLRGAGPYPLSIGIPRRLRRLAACAGAEPIRGSLETAVLLLEAARNASTAMRK